MLTTTVVPAGTKCSPSNRPFDIRSKRALLNGPQSRSVSSITAFRYGFSCQHYDRGHLNAGSDEQTKFDASSYVGIRSGEVKAPLISAINRFCTSGLRAHSQRAQQMVIVVVSVPATRNMMLLSTSSSTLKEAGVSWSTNARMRSCKMKCWR